MERYFPERLTGSIIPMECEHCDYHSDIFMIECPICQSELVPSILRRFRLFKSIYLKIEKNYSLKNLLYYEKSSDLSFGISDSDFKKMSAFLVSFFSQFYSHIYYNIFSLYAWNFRYLLKKDYLYRFRKSFLEELFFIEKKMNLYQKSSEEYSHLIIHMELREDEKPFFFLSRILRRYIHKITNQDNISDEEKVVNYLVVHAINELIRRLKAKLLQFERNIEKGIREFTEWLFEFSLKEDDYCVIPHIFLKYLESEETQSILYKLELELYYLPTKNIHLVVKRSFEPDLKPLERLTKTRGGLSLYLIEEELKLSYIEAALLIQILLRRKLGITTYSYLKGRKFYLRI